MEWRRAIAFLLPVSWPCVVAVVGLFSAAPAASVVRSEAGLEVIATGVLRPLQVAIDHDALVVLGPGAVGDLAGEIHRVDLSGGLPVDLTRQPRTAIPFADAQMSTLGSMALEPTTGDLFLGEENGTAIYRLSRDRLSRYTTGLHRLVGGSSPRSARFAIIINKPPDKRPTPDPGQRRTCR